MAIPPIIDVIKAFKIQTISESPRECRTNSIIKRYNIKNGKQANVIAKRFSFVIKGVKINNSKNLYPTDAKLPNMKISGFPDANR
jgi:hypothetical protein